MSTEVRTKNPEFFLSNYLLFLSPTVYSINYYKLLNRIYKSKTKDVCFYQKV